MKKSIIIYLLFISGIIFSLDGCTTVEEGFQSIDEKIHKSKLSSKKFSSDKINEDESEEMKAQRIKLNKLIGKTKASIMAMWGSPAIKSLDKKTDLVVFTYRKKDNRLECHFKNNKMVKWVFYDSKL